MSLIHRIATHVGTRLMTGLAMAGTSLFEIVDTLEDPSVGAHHGVLLFSVLTILRAAGEMAIGAEEASRALGHGED